VRANLVLRGLSDLLDATTSRHSPGLFGCCHVRASRPVIAAARGANAAAADQQGRH
jgi:hypothetical protein